MVDGQPYLSLCVVDTAEVAPGNGKPWLTVYGLHVARLRKKGEGGGRRREEGRVSVCVSVAKLNPFLGSL